MIISSILLLGFTILKQIKHPSKITVVTREVIMQYNTSSTLENLLAISRRQYYRSTCIFEVFQEELQHRLTSHRLMASALS